MFCRLLHILLRGKGYSQRNVLTPVWWCVGYILSALSASFLCPVRSTRAADAHRLCVASSRDRYNFFLAPSQPIPRHATPRHIRSHTPNTSAPVPDPIKLHDLTTYNIPRVIHLIFLNLTRITCATSPSPSTWVEITSAAATARSGRVGTTVCSAHHKVPRLARCQWLG